jgi:hypothetical protein
VSYVRDNAETIVEQMANSQFKLTDAEAEAMGDAAPVVARYMARSHLVSMANVVGALNKALPQVVGNLIQISNAGSAIEQKFFSDYPALQNVDRGQLAMLATTLRRANPTATAEQFLPVLARTVAAMTGTQLPPVRGKSQPHIPASSQQRGAAPTPGGQSRRTVNTAPLQGINMALRDGE